MVLSWNDISPFNHIQWSGCISSHKFWIMYLTLQSSHTTHAWSFWHVPTHWIPFWHSLMNPWILSHACSSFFHSVVSTALTHVFHHPSRYIDALCWWIFPCLSLRNLIYSFTPCQLFSILVWNTTSLSWRWRTVGAELEKGWKWGGLCLLKETQ